MKTPNQTHGVHILDSIFAVAFELLAPDYLDRYQPSSVRPIPVDAAELPESLDVTQVLQAVEVQS